MDLARNLLQTRRKQLLRLSTASILSGTVAVLLSGLVSSDARRLVSLGEGYHIDTVWFGWPVQFLYQIDVVQPQATTVSQSVDGYLLGIGWITWTVVFISLGLMAIIVRAFYAHSRD